MFSIYMNEKLQITITLLYVGACIIIYSIIRCTNQEIKDPLQKILGGKNTRFAQMLDGWSISHFIFYGALANIYPNEIPFIIFCGILWEIFEYLTSNSNLKILGILRGISECKIVTGESQTWFYAKYTDILMNVLGCLIGYLIYKYTNLQIKNVFLSLLYPTLLFIGINVYYNYKNIINTTH